ARGSRLSSVWKTCSTEYCIIRRSLSLGGFEPGNRHHHAHAAVDVNGLPGDEERFFFRGKEGGGADEIAGLSDALGKNAGRQGGPDHRIFHHRLDGSGRDKPDPKGVGRGWGGGFEPDR